MPISVIADITKVQRMTVYSWLNGDTSNNDRLNIIYTLLKDHKDVCNIYRLWNRIVLGVTIGGLLKEDNLDIEKIQYTLKDLLKYQKFKSIAYDLNSNPFIKDTREVSLHER